MMHLVHRGKDAALKALLAKQMDLYILVTDSSPRSSDYSDAPEAPVRIVGKHLSGLRDALRQHICGEAALELHSDDSP